MALQRNGFLCRIVHFEETGAIPTVTAEAGVYHDRLQTFLKKRGYYLPADPSSAAISQIGGNITTGGGGPHALRHGANDRYLEEPVFFTARGELVNTADRVTIQPISAKRSQRSPESSKTTPRQKTFSNIKIASAYNLAAFLEEVMLGQLITPLFADSVGTLGFITQATLRPEPYDVARAAMILYFRKLGEAAEVVVKLKPLGIAAMEIMNRETVHLLARRRGTADLLENLAHVLFLEFVGEDRFQQMNEVKRQLRQARAVLVAEPKTAETDGKIAKLSELGKKILPLISQAGPDLEALSVVNDVAVSPKVLAPFIMDLENLFKKHGTETLIYGHAGNGNLHLRPLFDVHRPGLKKRIQKLADDVYELVFKYDGTISGEHGMGRARAPYLRREWA